MAPSPSKKSSGLANPRLRMYIKWLKNSDKSEWRPEKLTEDLRNMNQHVASLMQDARQPRLAMEVDGPADTKTRERTEGAATAVQPMHGDSFSANMVQAGPKTISTNIYILIPSHRLDEAVKNYHDTESEKRR